MGLLDTYNQANSGIGGLLGGLQPDQNRALQSLALGLLSSSGWSKMPITLGQAFGQAGAGALQAQDEYKQNDMRQKLLQSQIDEHNYQNQQRKADLTSQNAVSGYVDSGLPMDQHNFGKYLAQMPSAKYQEQGIGMLIPQKMVEVGPGGALVNPLTGEVQYQNPLNRSGNQFGMTPVWGKDAQGNDVLLQLSGSGGVAPVQMPQGVTASPSLQYKDTGGSIIGLDRTGGVKTAIGKTLQPDQQPGYIQTKKAAEITGEASATAKLNLPQVQQEGKYMLTLLDELKTHPGLKYAVGAGSVLPTIPGTPQADFRARLGQVNGKQFLQAFETLKGGGQITEVEGKKATDAIARLQASQSPAEFNKAVDEFKGIINNAMARARAKAGQSGAAPTGGAKFLGFE